ncbi:hypothetical protein LA303_04595 [Candidatus Sulfidibacterium hydrothermale]|uniref:hypothetical protein n=1 Tax=Candidatus Sulfidibacterium hydrothermale TaxID=2875962 RepID=UPI001F0A35AE|nr:hypothetical protein [Candidatus Sulfidibacterium hydrothermale]UBM63253.1 hypothetical protein LA303_04595 [Candidatus Sulfidibacterium hydrothermale]
MKCLKWEIPKNKKSNHKKIPKINFFCPSEQREESILTTASLLRSFTSLRSVQDDNGNANKVLKINQPPVTNDQFEIPKSKKANHKKIPKINFFCPSEQREESILTTASLLRSFTSLHSVQDDNGNANKALKINQSPVTNDQLEIPKSKKSNHKKSQTQNTEH